VLVVKQIHVEYTLRLDPDADRDKVRRAFDRHMPYCPVYRSIAAAIDVTTSLRLEIGV
jgi:uncharacterized OsmC-like protein